MLWGKTFAVTANEDVTAAAKPTAFIDLMTKQSTIKTVPSGARSRKLHICWGEKHKNKDFYIKTQAVIVFS